MALCSRKTAWLFAVAILGGVSGGLTYAYMNGAFVKARAVPAYRVTGRQDAPIRIEEYTDLQCPACARGNMALGKIMSAYGQHIRLLFRHTPLPMHKWAVPAAIAAECAGRQGLFFPYADKLYATQDAWKDSPSEPEMFTVYAKEMGLDGKTFAVCRKDDSVRREITLDSAYASEKHIDSTPTFIVNGRQYQGGRELLEAAAAFEDIISKSGK